MIFQNSAFSWLCLWATVWMAAAEEEIGSPLRIAQCRAHCILKFSKELESQRICFQEPDCYMCWENCQLLQANYPIWGGICSETGICFPGCQEACRFHREMSPVQQSVPVIQTRGEEVIYVKNHTAYWPEPARNQNDSADPLVYVVMRRLPGKMWRQIIQTLETSSRVPEDLSTGALLRVLVVDKDGLLTIYSPIASESSLRSANDIARSSGQKSLNNLFASANSSSSQASGAEEGNRSRRINTEIARKPMDSNSSSDAVAEYSAWNLREISLIHQKVLVIAEIAWDAVPTYLVQRAVYFVTWEVDGGGLKGNLFTDSTCVTLSLWPDTVYHIQVELVGHSVATGRPQQSEDFLLDTHRAIAVELETSSPDLVVLTATPKFPAAFDEPSDSNEIGSLEMPRDSHGIPLTPNKFDMFVQNQHAEVILAIITAFVVFLLVLIMLVYISCRHSDVLSYPMLNNDIFSLKPNRKSSMNSIADRSRIPKEIVPILTLVSENISKKPTMSQNNSNRQNYVVNNCSPNNRRHDQLITKKLNSSNPSHTENITNSKSADDNQHQYRRKSSTSPFRKHFCDTGSQVNVYSNWNNVS